jgi:hypothetical protein
VLQYNNVSLRHRRFAARAKELIMEHVNKDRRRLLQAAALMAGAAAPFAFTRTAGAWDVTPLDPASPAGIAYSERCGGSQEHAALSQKLKLALANDPAAASLSAACPICGCPVVVSR